MASMDHLTRAERIEIASFRTWLPAAVGGLGAGILHSYDHKRLKDISKEYGLGTKGTKDDLKARLQDYALQRLRAAMAAVPLPLTPTTVNDGTIMNDTNDTFNPDFSHPDLSLSQIDCSTPAAAPMIGGPRQAGIRAVRRAADSPFVRPRRSLPKRSLDPDASIDARAAQIVFGERFANDAGTSRQRFDQAMSAMEENQGIRLSRSSVAGPPLSSTITSQHTAGGSTESLKDRFEEAHQREFNKMQSISDRGKKRPIESTFSLAADSKKDGSLRETFKKRVKIAASSFSSATSKSTQSSAHRTSMNTRMVSDLRETGFIVSPDSAAVKSAPQPKAIQFKQPAPPALKQTIPSTPKFTSDERKRRLLQQARAKRRSSGQHFAAASARRSSLQSSARKSAIKKKPATKWQKTVAFGKASLFDRWTRPTAPGIGKSAVSTDKSPLPAAKLSATDTLKSHAASKPPRPSTLPRFAQSTASSKAKVVKEESMLPRNRSELLSPRAANSASSNHGRKASMMY